MVGFGQWRSDLGRDERHAEFDLDLYVRRCALWRLRWKRRGTGMKYRTLDAITPRNKVRTDLGKGKGKKKGKGSLCKSAKVKVHYQY